MAEIKEIKEKRQKEDNVLISIAAGNKHTITPDLEFEYPDTEIHDDIYKIIQYSCKEVCSTKEQLHKVLRFWTTFLEPMLGVLSRPHATEDDGASKDRIVKNSMGSTLESEDSPNGDAATALKQPKANGNGDSTTSPQLVNFSRNTFRNMDTLAKEGQNAVSAERLINSDVALTSASNANHGMFLGETLKDSTSAYILKLCEN